jgi:hypothetical protein
MLDQKKSPRPPAARSTVDIVRSLVAAGEIRQVQRLTLAQRAAVTLGADTGTAELQISAASMDDLPVILSLVEEAKGWLRTKGTDQWSTDWPDGSGKNRSDRAAASLAGGRTWLVWFAPLERSLVTGEGLLDRVEVGRHHAVRGAHVTAGSLGDPPAAGEVSTGMSISRAAVRPTRSAPGPRAGSSGR